MGPLANALVPCLWPAPHPHPLSDRIPNLHSHPATEQKPHPEKKIPAPIPRPPPSVLIFIFSYSSSVPSFVSEAAAEKAAGSCLPAQLYQSGELGQAPGLPLYPEVLVPATYPGCGTSPRYLPEPLGLGSTLSFLSGPLNPQPMCTQGYSRSAMSKTLSLRLGSTRMKQVSSSLAVLTWSLDGLAWEAGGRLRSGQPAQRRFWTFWWQGRPRGWKLGGKEKGVCGSGFSWLRRY